MNFTYKNIIILIIISTLTSCWIENETEQTNEDIVIEYDSFIVWWTSLKSRNLQWNILSNNSITKASWIAWNITKLNCEAWKVVYPKTLIATITPDYTNPNIKSLLTSRDSLNLQLQNLKWIKLSTINNLDTQISTLVSSISSTNNGLNLALENYEMLVKQKGLTSSDLGTQLETLEEQLVNLIKQKDLLNKSKKEELEKLNNSLENLKTTSYNTIWDILLYIDELYWVTNENRDKNDKFDNYLWVKDSSLKNKVKTDFRNLNNIDYRTLSWDELSEYQNKLNDLIKLTNSSVKKSIVSVGSLTETDITTHYNTLLWYSNWLLTIKTNLDTIIKNKSTIENTYDGQIAWLSTNIDSLKWNIDNLKNNKTQSALLSLDVNITNLKSQINSLENGVVTLDNNLKSLKENKQITIKQLDNQVLTLTQNIDKLNIGLSPQYIYAWITWKISNSFTYLNTSVWPWVPICGILADWKNTLKMSVSSANKLIDWYIYSVVLNNNIIFTWSILSALPIKDIRTQNYIYEKVLENDFWFIVWDKVNVVIDYPENNTEFNGLSNDIIEVPIEYVIPRLDWYFVKFKDLDWNIKEKNITIWEVSLPNIQVIDWVELWETLIK